MAKILFAVSSLFFGIAAQAQNSVVLHVDASATSGPVAPFWNYFGYDEPNATYTGNGRKLMAELAASSQVPVHIRAHNLLTTGPGSYGLKWGSTNAYREDANGKPLYDWTIVDKIIEAYVKASAIPVVEIGFMPEALSSKPDPYTPNWQTPDDFKHYFVGWTYPPRDYDKWGDLIYAWVNHEVERFSKAEVNKWDWEVWNEPDIPYWHGTPAEYDQLYDYTAAALKRALPSARIGGPASTSPRNPKAATFLRQFLEHCASGKNYATQQIGAPLDFISFHAKGRPEIVSGHVRMGLAKQMEDISDGLNIVRSFSQFRDLPVIISEWDPEGCGACSSAQNPANAYRNGVLYPAYVAAASKATLQIATREHANLAGALTWAFEYEGQPDFAGFRDLATNGIDKPVLNVFRMLGLMHGGWVKVDGESGTVGALASQSVSGLAVMVWNYQDDDVPAAAADVKLVVTGLPDNAKRALVTQFRIDDHHSNAYTVWKEMGSPQAPTPAQQSILEAAGQLQMLESPRWVESTKAGVNLDFDLPLPGVSLILLSW